MVPENGTQLGTFQTTVIEEGFGPLFIFCFDWFFRTIPMNVTPFIRAGTALKVDIMSPLIDTLKTRFAATLLAISNKLDTKLDRSSAAVSADKLTDPFQLNLTGHATATANVDGSGPVNLNVTFQSTGVSAGVYPKVTVDQYGRVVAGSLLLVADIPELPASKITTGTFDVALIPSLDASKISSGIFAAARIPVLNQSTTGNAATASRTHATAPVGEFRDLVTGSMAANDSFRIRVGGDISDSGWVEFATLDNGTEPFYFRQYNTSATISREIVLLGAGGVSTFPGPITAPSFNGNAATATRLSSAFTLGLSGDANGSLSIDGGSNVTMNVTLANSGVVAGTYGGATQIPQVTVDNKGRVTGVTLIDIKAQTAMAVNEYITVAAGGVKSYDLQTLLGPDHAAFDKKTAEICVRVKDINGSSPLYNAYANAEALVSYGIKDERTVIIANQHTAPVDLYVKVLVHPL